MEENQQEQQKEQERKWCIYIHINKINGKVYIGQTCQKVNSRWGKDGCRYVECPHLWNAIQKYGWENFEHKILYKGLTLEEANRYEQELIEQYDARNPEHGYNIKEGGLNGHHSEETKRKISQNQPDHSGSKNGMYGRCGALNPMYGKRGKDSPNYGRKKSEASKDKMRGEKNPMYGVHLVGELNPNFGKHLSEERKKRISEAKKGKMVGKDNPSSRPVRQYTKDGIFIKEWECIAWAEKELNIAHQSIGQCCRGKHKTAGGYIWKYADSSEDELIKMMEG